MRQNLELGVAGAFREWRSFSIVLDSAELDTVRVQACWGDKAILGTLSE